MKTKWNRRWNQAALLCLAVTVAYLAWWGIGFRGLQAARKALVTAGRPMLASEILPREVPDHENAALLYVACWNALKASEVGGDSLWTLLGASAKKGDPAFATQIQDPYALAALALLARASDMPACRFEVDYSQGPSIRLPHLHELRQLSTLLNRLALLQLESGDPNEAWRVAGQALALCHALEAEPILISQLTRVAMATRAMGTLEALLRDHAVPVGQVQDLLAGLRRLEDRTPFVCAVDGERLFLAEWVFSPTQKSVRKQSLREMKRPFPLTLPPLMVRDHAEYLRISLAQTRRALGVGMADEPSPKGIFTAIIVPAIEPALEKQIAMESKARELRLRMEADTAPLSPR